jgi:hypothetical protein
LGGFDDPDVLLAVDACLWVLDLEVLKDLDALLELRELLGYSFVYGIFFFV